MRRFLLPALLLAAAPLAHAQAARPTFGVRAGLNVANVYGANESDLDGFDKKPILGFVGGVFAEVPVTPGVAFRPEVLYSQKGFSLDASGADGGQQFDISQTLHADYVEVPLLARVALPLSPLLRVGLMAGPAVAFKVRESIDVEFLVDGQPFPDFEDLGDIDTEDVIKTVDLGGVIGAEVGSGPFAVDLRYTAGFLDINKNTEGDSSAPTIRNGVFSVTGSFRFGR